MYVGRFLLYPIIQQMSLVHYTLILLSKWNYLVSLFFFTTCFGPNWPSSGVITLLKLLNCSICYSLPMHFLFHFIRPHNIRKLKWWTIICGSYVFTHKTINASKENGRPLLYKQGSYNTRTRQVDDTPVSEKILKF
jgi:hypothetical protein